MKKIVMDFGPYYVRTGLVIDNELIELLIDKYKNTQIVDNVYVGRVLNITKSKFAFIHIGTEKNAFLQLDDPKQKDYLKDHRLHIGDEILVQVIKEAEEEKGPCVTTEISASGKYLVLMKGQEDRQNVRISSKITKNSERDRLRAVAERFLSPGFHLIMRTESEGKSEDVLKKEYGELEKGLFKTIQQGAYAKAPAAIVKENIVYAKSLRLLLDGDVSEIIVNSAAELLTIETMAGKYLKDYKLNCYDENVNLFRTLLLESQIEKALQTKVWLKSGGFILIEHTSACTVIDVNTGKFVNKKNKEGAIIKNNLEAATEIAKQLRLRNLSGMILIDFVDMKDEDHRSWLMNHLRKEFKNDRVPVNIIEISSLNVVQLTRKKTRAPFYMQITQPCPFCKNKTFLYDADYICTQVYEEIETILKTTNYNQITIKASKKIIKNLNRVPGLEKFNAAIILEARDDIKDQDYTIVKEKIIP